MTFTNIEHVPWDTTIPGAHRLHSYTTERLRVEFPVKTIFEMNFTILVLVLVYWIEPLVNTLVTGNFLIRHIYNGNNANLNPEIVILHYFINPKKYNLKDKV